MLLTDTLKIAWSVRRWRSVKTKRGFLVWDCGGSSSFLLQTKKQNKKIRLKIKKNSVKIVPKIRSKMLANLTLTNQAVYQRNSSKDRLDFASNPLWQEVALQITGTWSNLLQLTSPLHIRSWLRRVWTDLKTSRNRLQKRTAKSLVPICQVTKCLCWAERLIIPRVGGGCCFGCFRLHRLTCNDDWWLWSSKRKKSLFCLFFISLKRNGFCSQQYLGSCEHYLPTIATTALVSMVHIVLSN